MSEKDIKMEEVNSPETKEMESAGPSEYEYLEPEKAQEEETTPTDPHLATLNAIEEIPSLLTKLQEDNTQYEVHVQLINALKLAEMPDELEEARQNMHEVYPLTEALWLDWINDAKKEADTTEGELKLRELYKEAEKDYLSIPIWKSYVDFVLEKFYAAFGDEENGVKEESDEIKTLIEITRHDLLTAVSNVTYHVKSSQEIWKPFAQFELSILQRFPDDEQQKERMEKVYLDRLSVVHIDCEDTFNAYSSFISEYNNMNYEETMVKANKIYAKTKVAAEERDVFELQLVNTGYALDSFYQYIQHEKTTKNKFSLNNVRSLYERAIAIYCTDQQLWNDYILYLIEKARVPSFLKALTSRAIRNCPWSGTMWAHLTRFMESNQEERDDIIGTFDRGFENRLLLSSMDDLITLALAKCDYERRQVDWLDPDENQIMNLRIAFMEALQILEENFPGKSDPYYRIEKYYAFIEDKRLGNADGARELWESVIQKHGKDTEAYIQYIYFERDQHNYKKCSDLFKKAISKRVDNLARLVDVWNTIEREIGSIESMEECLVQSHKQSKFLQLNWEVKAAHDEERVERENKKKENEKRKKGIRRMESKKKKQMNKMKEKEEKKQEDEKEEMKQEEMKQEEETQPSTTSGGLKRKASMDLEDPKKKMRNESPVNDDMKKGEPKMDGEFRRPDLPFRPRNARGGGGRGGGRGGRGRGGFWVPKVKLETQDDNVNTEKSDDASKSSDAPKSNDDFRSMLLGKK